MACLSSSSKFVRAVAILTLFGCVSMCFAGAAPTNRGHVGGSVSQGFLVHKIPVHDVETGLSSSLEVLLQGGQGAAAQHLARVEASMWQTFQALPKNKMGRLEPRSVRYIVHNYFSKEHGWLIKGLEPHAHRADVTEMHEVGILQDKAPALVEALLEAKQSGRGLALNDVVAMASALEWLILEESIEVLRNVYVLNDQTPADHIDQKALQEVLLSYLIVLEQGGNVNISQVARHQAIKAGMAKMGITALVEYEEDAVRSFVFKNRHQTNPFVPTLFSFEEASRVVEDMARGYGKWQNNECGEMKDDLMDLDTDGNGRIPLHVFYSQPKSASYQFSESVEYLKEVGALDTSVDGSPQVRIANYLAGPSNCISNSAYYSVCCLNECEGLMTEIEETVWAPTASVARVVEVVGNLSSATVDAPRQLSKSLIEKLGYIAERHGGEVPFYGRLFAQWLHYAFPNECPYPHVAESAATLTATHWLDGKASSTEEERKRHIELGSKLEANSSSVSADDELWSDDEILPLHDRQFDVIGFLKGAVRLVVLLALCLVVLRTATTASLSLSGPVADKQTKACMSSHFV